MKVGAATVTRWKKVQPAEWKKRVRKLSQSLAFAEMNAASDKIYYVI